MQLPYKLTEKKYFYKYFILYFLFDYTFQRSREEYYSFVADEINIFSYFSIIFCISIFFNIRFEERNFRHPFSEQIP